MKKKGTTALLALMFGLFGVHRFYLGQRLKGFLQVILFMITMIITIEEDAPVIFIPAIIGFIDAVLFYVMPEEEFDEKYNQRYLRADEERHPSRFFEKRG
ncbi:MAG TPA: TM2 domain-containing protein, partial [Phaeodactylibacter sp.]|nr:TM2 domain-containing protein [Phaeodactylibacter sp.]